ncbi:MAG: sigma-70 family RNA polymerase sigma factor [Verrucomicrobia bacterium]|nr:sigma-70 family RNA polymerase sigma factor [Verrucomicrobiota bacterium]
MLEQTDAQLLRDYAEHRNEAAFRELVSRHADVVYASALRQVSSPDLAHDIAQSVFTDLARKAQPLAGTLTGETSLLGWLYRSTRFLALNQLRDDRRRQARERHAMQHFDPASETAPEWERVQPVLDEAMADLSDEDRDALLLRFFKSHDFRAIGAALGVSDDAAQKRVSRALERLRTQLTSRGVTTTAVALSTVLSTNAAPVAPAGLATTLSTTALAGTSLATTATTAIQTIAMTTLQKTIVATALAVVAGAGIYEARQASNLRNQVETLQQQQMPLVDQLNLVNQALHVATNQIAGLREENEQLKRSAYELPKLRGDLTRLKNELQERSPASINFEAASWLGRANHLKEALDQKPDAKIPEMELLTTKDWLNVSQNLIETEDDYRRAFSKLRSHAENSFLSKVQGALTKFLESNKEEFPTDLSKLKPFFESPVSEAMLERYEVVPTTSLRLKPSEYGDWLIALKYPIDQEYDQRWYILTNGMGTVLFPKKDQK